MLAMDEPIIKLDYEPIKRQKKRGSIWSRLALLSLPLLMADVFVLVPRMLAGLAQAWKFGPASSPMTIVDIILVVPFFALAGGGFLCGIIGLIHTLCHREQYFLPYPIIGVAALPTLPLVLWLLVRLW